MKNMIVLAAIIAVAVTLCLFVWWGHGRMTNSIAEPSVPGLQSGTEDGSVGGLGSGGGGQSGGW